MALALEATVLLASAGQAAQLAVLVHGVGDPVNARVITDCLVCRVHEDDLKILVHSVLIYPVRIQDTETATFTTNTFLSDVAKVAGRLQLRDTCVHWLAIDNTLRMAHQREP